MKEKLYLMKGTFFLVKIVITLSVLPVSDILFSWGGWAQDVERFPCVP